MVVREKDATGEATNNAVLVASDSLPFGYIKYPVLVMNVGMARIKD
jgi:hypothetical protein